MRGWVLNQFSTNAGLKEKYLKFKNQFKSLAKIKAWQKGLLILKKSLLNIS